MGFLSTSKRTPKMAILACIVIILTCCMQFVSAEAEHHITAAVLTDFAPLYQFDSQGRPEGFAVDILKAVAEQAGFQIEYLPTKNWAEAMQAVRDGRADLIPGIGISNTRLSEFLFSHEIETVPVSWFVRRDSRYIDSLADLKHHKIAVIKESAAATRLKHQTQFKLIAYETPESALFGLLSGGVDAVVFPKPVFLKKVREINLEHKVRVLDPPLMELKRGYLYRADNLALKDRLDPHINEYLLSDAYQNAYLKWYGRPTPFWTTTRVFWAVLIMAIALVLGIMVSRYLAVNRLNQRLRVSEEKFRIYVESIPEGIFVVDANGHYLDVNRWACEILGYSREELLQLTFADLVLPGSLCGNLDLYGEVKRSGQLDMDLDLRKKDGAVISVLIKAVGLPDNHVMSLCIDTTELKQTEASLRKSERSLAEAQRIAHIGNWWLKMKTGELHWSDEIYRIFGLQPKEFEPSYERFFAAVHPDDIEAIKKSEQEAFSKREPHSIDHRIILPDGSIRWVHEEAVPTFGDDGQMIYLAGTVQDITEQKRTEEALRRSEQAYNEAQRLAKIGSWEFDIHNNMLKWSDEIYRIFEIDPTRFGASYDAFLSAIHPDDRDAVDTAYRRSLETRLPYSIRHRLRMADGRIKHVYEQCQTEFDAAGNPLRSLGTVQDVTKQVLAEAALQESRSLLEAVIENVPVRIFWKDRELNYLGCNPAFARDAGKDNPSEMIGKDDYQMGWAHEAELYRADDLKVIESGIPKINFEEPQTTPDGKEIWLRTSKVPLRNRDNEVIGVLGIYDDITDTKHMHEELVRHRDHLEQLVAERSVDLAEAKLKYQRLLDDMGDEFMAFSYTPEGVTTYVSNSIETIFGFTREAVLGRRWTELIQWVPEDLEVAIQRIDDLILGKVEDSRTEIRFLHRDGRMRTIYTTTHVIRDDAGKPIALDGMMQDISERKRVEVELNNAKTAAETASLAKSAFLANMSHEIRTPMNAIIGMSHLALKTDLNTKQRNYIEKVHCSAEGLLGIINDILDFSKIESGKLELEERDFRLEDVINSVNQLIVLKSEEKLIELRLDIDPAVPTVLHGDQLRLRQILTNLAGNAVKFTPEGGKILIGVAVEEDEKETVLLHISVKDSGIGITKEQQAKLFQSFSQVDSTITRQYGGTGLGLAIAKRLTEIMGGKIWVESIPQVGSTFHFTIRTKKQRGQPSPRHQYLYDLETATRTAIDKLQGTKILLVEDNELNQELALELLTSNGIQVETASNGREAITLLDRIGFDGVLMDCQMPVMDGYTATRKIREQARFKDLPILAMTANTMSGDREKALAAGMNDHIAKPINLDEMFNTMACWVGPKQAAASGGMSKAVMGEPLATEIPVARSSTADALPPLPGIDIHAGLSIASGKMRLYRKLLIMARNNYRDFEHQFRAAQQDQDPEAATRLAHSLKGVAGSIGAPGVQQAALALEMACKEGDDEMEAKLATLVAKLETVVQGLEAIGNSP